ncbi:MAG TPA: 2-dehydropantoate 2-reductase [Roseiflexaceae bacterium]|nr:2-dehydropantoate 2-reductase [Roseiflexaceae bacterium]
MAIVVVGAGAIGLLVAGQLADSGQPTILLARPSVAAAIEQQRVRVMQDGVLHVAEDLVTITDPAQLPPQNQPPELAILCVKAYDTVGALPTLSALNPQAVLTLQNGIGSEEILADCFGAGRIVSGAITSSVEIAAPGRIEVVKRGGIGLAAMAPAARLATARALEALRGAGYDAREFDDYRALKWSKALLNMLGNATAAILDMPVAQVYADARLVALERRGFLEALAVMEKLGIAPVSLPRYPVKLLARAMRYMPAALLNPVLRRKVAGGRGGKPPSLQIGLAQGNPRSEGEFLYGAVARAGAACGVDTPVNRALWETLHAIASGTTAWDTYRGKPGRLLDSIASYQK